MKKMVTLIALLLVCTWAKADSMDRFINRYKEKDGAEYRVINVNSTLDELMENGAVKGRKRASLLRGTLVMMGIEEIETLNLDLCKSSVRSRFFANVLDEIPEGYSILTETGDRIVYVNNMEEDFAFVIIVNNNVEKPRLTRMYVSNAFMRAVMNDEGTEVDGQKLERYLEGRADKLEESAKEGIRAIENGLRRLEKRIEERGANEIAL
ncbi:MAG: hypothetical protein IKV15_07060 [Bacteroidaceae bacterium]|nr:hypothetical protein [Bacteroidaceae bacterium]